MTVGTDAGDRLLMTAVVALHRPGIHVESQGDVTVGTLENRSTVPAHHKGGKAPAVKHQNALFSPG